MNRTPIRSSSLSGAFVSKTCDLVAGGYCLDSTWTDTGQPLLVRQLVPPAAGGSASAVSRADAVTTVAAAAAAASSEPEGAPSPGNRQQQHSQGISEAQSAPPSPLLEGPIPTPVTAHTTEPVPEVARANGFLLANAAGTDENADPDGLETPDLTAVPGCLF